MSTMESTISCVASPIIFRHVEKHEQQLAIQLWCSIFDGTAEFYERYFSVKASPNYREGDTLGAWHEDRLVSVVHIHRMILRSSGNNEKYVCGGIGRVATVAEYRRRGLSRHLLRMAIDKMEKSNEFDMSMLGTDIHGHYAVLGWEQVLEPTDIVIDWKATILPSVNAKWCSAIDALSENSELLLEIYSNSPRIFQIDRSSATQFQHWVTLEWESDRAIVGLYEYEQQHGYVVIGQPNSEKDVCILEWRAPALDLEKSLLSLAAAEIRNRHGSTVAIRMLALPQHMTIDQLVDWTGPLRMGVHPDGMMRNIRLATNVYEKIKTAFADGHAVFWTGDYF